MKGAYKCRILCSFSRVLDYIEGDNISWEIDPLEKLVKEKQLFSFEHSGFWHPMDTLRR